MREKLIELLMDMPFGHSTCEEERHMEDLADYLIANGVTVQQWIPVTERLPNEEDATENDGFIVAIMNGHSLNIWKWFKVAAFPHYFTHWMPLPTPAKEG